MKPIRESEETPQPVIGAAAPVDLDLAFSAGEGFSAELLQAGGPWCDPLQGEEAWRSLLANWLTQLAAELRPELRSDAYSLGLSLTNDDEIAVLNAEWRDKASPTDVLAFAAQDDGLEQAPPVPMPTWAEDEDDLAELALPLELGDIVISLDTAARQAEDAGQSLRQELLFLASHGLLHLLGWDHPDEASLAAMLQRQQALLENLPADWDAATLF